MSFFPDPILYLKTGKTHAFSHATRPALPATTRTALAPKIVTLMRRETNRMER
jgi:hypothetical protein